VRADSRVRRRVRHMLWLRRGSQSVVASVLICLACTSCLGVTGGPEDLGPFALGFENGSQVVVACDELTLEGTVIFQSVYVDGERGRVEEIAKWDPEQTLRRGDPVRLEASTPESGVGGLGSIEPNATYFVESFGVKGPGVTATFRVPAEGVPLGMWLGSDQSINSTPCDYWDQ
jgi:hypothetical protein